MVEMETRPWWRDPVWLTTGALCGILLASAYVYSRVQDRRTAIRSLAHVMRLQGDLLLAEEKPREALGHYRDAIRLIQERGGGDPGLRAEQAEVQAKIDQITRGAKEGSAR